MHPTYQFSHTYGYLSQRFRCPLLFPQASGQMRVTSDRDSPLYKGIYCLSTSAERINSQSKALGIATQ
jgi:hypothetical protein